MTDNCERYESYADLLPLLGSGELTPDEEQRVWEHTRDCERCRREAHELGEASMLVGQPQRQGWSADVVAPVRAQLARRQPRKLPEIPALLRRPTAESQRRTPVAGIFAGVAVAALLIAAFALVSLLRPTPEQGMEPGPGPNLEVLPPMTSLSIGPPQNYALVTDGSAQVGLAGDPGSVPGPEPRAAMPVYRLSQPTPLTREEAVAIVRSKFAGLDPALSGPTEGQMGGRGTGLQTTWSWRSDRHSVTIFRDTGTIIWNSYTAPEGGFPYGPGEVTPIDPAAALDRANRWLKDFGVHQGPLEPGTPLLVDLPFRGAEAAFYMRSNIAGLPVYTLSAGHFLFNGRVTPGTDITLFRANLDIHSFSYTPPRSVLSSQSYPLRSATAAWADVQRDPARHISYAGAITRGDGWIRLGPTTDHTSLFSSNRTGMVALTPFTGTLELKRVDVGYAYAGDASASGNLYMVPVYAFQVEGTLADVSGANPRPTTALLLAAAVNEKYQPAWKLPRPETINVYRDGQVKVLREGEDGYNRLFETAAPVLGRLGNYKESIKEQALFARRTSGTWVEFAYDIKDWKFRQIEADSTVLFVDRILISVQPELHVWSGTYGEWYEVSTRGSFEGLLESVQQVTNVQAP